MDIEAMLKELRERRDALDEVIVVLERLQTGQKRRGRPPKWMTHAKDDAKEPEPPRTK